MPPPTPRVGTAAITENLLKRKWSTTILQYLSKGVNDPSAIARLEPDLSAQVLSERLRAMLRYGVIARFPRPTVVEYRLTLLGTKILELLNLLEQLDQQFRLNRPAGGNAPREIPRIPTKEDTPDQNSLRKPAV